MNPAGTENTGRHNFPARPSTTPFAVSPLTMTPFSTSGPVVGPEASGFRPTPPSPPQTTMPVLSSGPVSVPDSSGFRPTPPPARFSDPAVRSPPTSYAPPSAGPFQQFPAPQILTAQARPPPIGKPTAVQVSSQPVSLPPQPHVSSVPMGSPPQNTNYVTASPTARPNFQPPMPPPLESPYPASRTTSQPPFPGYASKQSSSVSQTPYIQTSFQAHQGSYVPAPPVPASPFVSHQGGYVHAPPAPPSLHSMDQMQNPKSGPPVGAIQGLVEDFSSLSFGSIPGSMDPGVDSKSMPRPLNDDIVPNSLAEMHPMNCNPRYLRLTTSAVPNSQSLVSRWHLPLGAVVCPLAEAPEGEQVPVVNFASAGIIRCRRCRTYVNPYVTFTDAGRKWRCNICTLLNDGNINLIISSELFVI